MTLHSIVEMVKLSDQQLDNVIEAAKALGSTTLVEILQGERKRRKERHKSSSQELRL